MQQEVRIVQPDPQARRVRRDLLAACVPSRQGFEEILREVPLSQPVDGLVLFEGHRRVGGHGGQRAGRARERAPDQGAEQTQPLLPHL